jgi:CheY-like chemotaxis protein
VPDDIIVRILVGRMPSTSRIPATAPTRTLLVDRDADTRQMYGEFLRQSFYEIEEAEDGREALAKALARLPDVIVTETRLPGISGYELCRLLRQDALTRSTPIVVVTGDAFEAAIARAQRAGANAVLVKPCLPERLADEISRVLSNEVETAERGIAARLETSAPSIASGNGPDAPTVQARRTMLSRVHRRGDTTTPPMPPPALVCPACDQSLRYLKSHVGGVSARHPEQWDDYECAFGCGTFQYRQRTRKLRRVR